MKPISKGEKAYHAHPDGCGPVVGDIRENGRVRARENDHVHHVRVREQNARSHRLPECCKAVDTVAGTQGRGNSERKN